MRFPLHPDTPPRYAVATLCAAQFALFAPAHVFLFAAMNVADLLLAALITGAMYLLWRRGGVVSALILVLVAIPIWIPPGIVHFDAFPFAAAATVVAAIVAVFFVRREKPFVRALVAALVFASGMAACTAWTMRVPSDADSARRDVSLLGVGRVIFDARTRPELDHLRHVLLDPTRPRLFVTRGFDWESKRDGVFAVDLATGAVTPIGATPAQAQVVDVERRHLIVGHFRTGELIAYDLDSLAPVAEIPIRRPIVFVPDRAGRSFWMLGERHPIATRWGFEGLYPVVRSANLGGLLPASMAVSEDRNAAYIPSNIMSPFNHLVELELDRLTVRREVSLGFRPTRSIVVDEGHSVLYLAHPLPGSIGVYNIGELRLVRSLPAPTGAYPLVFDPETSLVFVASYTTGELWAVDVESGQVRWRGYVGRRARGLLVDHERRKVYGTSSLGVFEIDVRRMIESSGPAAS